MSEMTTLRDDVLALFERLKRESGDIHDLELLAELNAFLDRESA